MEKSFCQIAFRQPETQKAACTLIHPPKETPAVAAFGITVSLGVGLNVLLSAWLLKKEGAGREAV